MICPSCGADYRAGFTQCSDCAVALVDVLSEVWKQTQAEASEFPPRTLLLWFVPLSVLSTLMPILLLLKLNPSRFHPLHIVVILVCLAVPIGGCWMFVQVIDHEERAKGWIPFTIIPFMFLWYGLFRYPVRPKFIRYPGSNN